ncbi:uncharacterized protein L203_104551 [Cryptococcus depauperatus CBS 7841]|uniref:Protein kinase domain-containing protein n=1 Tax=Cryptococcus depauperatus CBS 7841 TaxID=1295531 RepID=A0AAJ8JVX5_9TREE
MSHYSQLSIGSGTASAGPSTPSLPRRPQGGRRRGVIPGLFIANPDNSDEDGSPPRTGNQRSPSLAGASPVNIALSTSRRGIGEMSISHAASPSSSVTERGHIPFPSVPAPQPSPLPSISAFPSPQPFISSPSSRPSSYGHSTPEISPVPPQPPPQPQRHLHRAFTTPVPDQFQRPPYETHPTSASGSNIYTNIAHSPTRALPPLPSPVQQSPQHTHSPAVLRSQTYCIPQASGPSQQSNSAENLDYYGLKLTLDDDVDPETRALLKQLQKEEEEEQKKKEDDCRRQLEQDEELAKREQQNERDIWEMMQRLDMERSQREQAQIAEDEARVRELEAEQRQREQQQRVEAARVALEAEQREVEQRQRGQQSRIHAFAQERKNKQLYFSQQAKMGVPIEDTTATWDATLSMDSSGGGSSSLRRRSEGRVPLIQIPTPRPSGTQPTPLSIRQNSQPYSPNHYQESFVPRHPSTYSQYGEPSYAQDRLKDPHLQQATGRMPSSGQIAQNVSPRPDLRRVRHPFSYVPQELNSDHFQIPVANPASTMDQWRSKNGSHVVIPGTPNSESTIRPSRSTTIDNNDSSSGDTATAGQYSRKLQEMMTQLENGAANGTIRPAKTEDEEEEATLFLPTPVKTPEQPPSTSRPAALPPLPSKPNLIVDTSLHRPPISHFSTMQSASTPSDSATESEDTGDGGLEFEGSGVRRGKSFARPKDPNQWNFRPEPEQLYKDLDRVFPQIDLDQPIVQGGELTPSTPGLNSPSRVETSSGLPLPAGAAPGRQGGPQAGSGPLGRSAPSNYASPAPPGSFSRIKFNDSERRRSIRVVADSAFRRNLQRQSARYEMTRPGVPAMPVMSGHGKPMFDGRNDEQKKQGSRWSSSMWDHKLVEVTKFAQVHGKGEESIPESPAAENKPGTVTWIKGELIGKGSYGRVYIALNVTTGDMMAVKQVELPVSEIDRNDQRQQGMVKALRDEIELLKGLEHKNIVAYLGYETSPEYLSIFLEYVPGGTIASIYRTPNQARFEPQLVRFFTEQILEGLAYLHSKNIWHRDLKGDNILVDGQGICKISDFGISKQTADAYDSAGQATAMKGSVFWMAPEVLQSSNEQSYSGKVDIWSLGCVVIEMWTGQRPWGDMEVIAAMFELFSKRSRPPLPPDIILSPVALDFLNQCLATNPHDRPVAIDLLRHEFIKDGDLNWTFKNSKIGKATGICKAASFIWVLYDHPDKTRQVSLARAQDCVVGWNGVGQAFPTLRKQLEMSFPGIVDAPVAMSRRQSYHARLLAPSPENGALPLDTSSTSRSGAVSSRSSYRNSVVRVSSPLRRQVDGEDEESSSEEEGQQKVSQKAASFIGVGGLLSPPSSPEKQNKTLSTSATQRGKPCKRQCSMDSQTWSPKSRQLSHDSPISPIKIAPTRRASVRNPGLWADSITLPASVKTASVPELDIADPSAPKFSRSRLKKSSVVMPLSAKTSSSSSIKSRISLFSSPDGSFSSLTSSCSGTDVACRPSQRSQTSRPMSLPSQDRLAALTESRRLESHSQVGLETSELTPPCPSFMQRVDSAASVVSHDSNTSMESMTSGSSMQASSLDSCEPITEEPVQIREVSAASLGEPERAAGIEGISGTKPGGDVSVDGGSVNHVKSGKKRGRGILQRIVKALKLDRKTPMMKASRRESL